MQNETPTPEWDLDRLADYARRLVRRVKMAPRKVARDVFAMGSALSIVREKLKAEGEYDRWLRSERLPKTTAYHAVRLFEHFKTPDSLGKLTITQAKRLAGLVKAKPVTVELPAFVRADAPPVIRRLDGAIKAIIDAGEDIAHREDFRQLVAELVKLADLPTEAKGKGRKTKGGELVAG